MRYNSNSEEKPVSLRRFAVKGLYSPAYLSLLVQRKKLKANKIGRNFYTTKKLFIKYLELHARDDVRREYFKLFEEEESKKNKIIKKSEKLIQVDKATDIQLVNQKQVNFFVWVKKNIVKFTTVGIFVILLSLLFAQVLINFSDKSGIVAGEEEFYREKIEK